MPKIKLPTKSPHIDMTPMVDLFSVVLTFLMLTATMRQNEPAPVDTPYSISEKPTPDFNTFTLLLSKDDMVFLNFDNGPDTLLKYRYKVLQEMGKRYSIEFTESELRQFEKYPTSIGVPMEKMKEFLAAKSNKEKTEFQTGIPLDSLNNQLAMWILYTRKINPNVQACIRGDAGTSYPTVKRVLKILQEYEVKRFNLITSLEATKINVEETQE